MAWSDTAIGCCKGKGSKTGALEDHQGTTHQEGNGNPNDGFMPGGAFIGDENNVYRGKDLSNLSVPSLPKDASAFRGWRNSLIAKLSSIDRTGPRCYHEMGCKLHLNHQMNRSFFTLENFLRWIATFGCMAGRPTQ